MKCPAFEIHLLAMYSKNFIDNQIKKVTGIWLGKVLANDIQFTKVFPH